MVKSFYILKKIYENLENLFARLSSREFKLLLILGFVFGFFLIYIVFFEKIQDKNLQLQHHLQDLQVKYNDNEALLNENKETKYDFSLQEKLTYFSQDYQNKIKQIEQNLYKIKAKNLKFQTLHQKDDFFTFYEIRLEFISDFASMIKFINGLENDVKIKNLELKKEKENIKVSINLIFALV
ncbi:hypothetical protein IY971_04860 [Campylobacter volucris]|uniref:hypothetical protein n=1 Tax=Campylobacter volucris TaxID=1031542 RepID=UPI0018A0DB03|nr:hypothetical protein [Campylobacter volucris]MBF7042732.1 hypothetical protein [Campylobacter volucris]